MHFCLSLRYLTSLGTRLLDTFDRTGSKNQLYIVSSTFDHASMHEPIARLSWWQTGVSQRGNGSGVTQQR